MSDANRWKSEVGRRKSLGIDLEFEPQSIAAATDTAWPNSGLSAFLDEMVARGEMERTELMLCPAPACRHPLDAGMVDGGECPFCGFQFGEQDEALVRSTRFRIVGLPSRDIRWMVVVHGMNSRGPWQEVFSWMIANQLKYSAPVLIHKYGWAVIDVLLISMQRKLAKALGMKMRRAVEYARASGIIDRPDVLVHSFGSRLFSLVLLDEEFADLNFGRVITAGSIIRPDFDWSSMIEEGRIEAVLNQMGGKDIPVLAAQFFIPGSGPGGRKGYLDPQVMNQQEAALGHSGCLTERYVSAALAAGGIWQRFLTQPPGLFEPTAPYTPEPWRPALAPFRFGGRLISAVIFAIFALPSWIRRKLDR